jgi:hypothetical protein
LSGEARKKARLFEPLLLENVTLQEFAKQLRKQAESLLKQALELEKRVECLNDGGPRKPKPAPIQ